jgi:diguanylate cyclase (GGDEF)-like protein
VAQENIKAKPAKPIKSEPFVSLVVLIVLLGLVLYSVIGLVAEEQEDALFPKARGGIIDISSVDLTNSTSLPLSGNWLFYWEKLISYGQFSNITNTPALTRVPHTWIDISSENNQITKYGYATYKLNVKVAEHINQLALRVPTIGSAYRLYINEKLLAYGGEVGETPETASPSYRVGIFAFDVPASSFDIIVQVSNHDLIWGGIWEDLRIGTSTQLHTEQSRKNSLTSAMLAMFLTIAVFNLIQFSLKTVDRSPLIMTLICLGLMVREIEKTQMLAHLEIFYFDYKASILISFLTFYLCGAAIVGYIYLSFKRDYNKWIMYAILAVSAFFCLHALITSTTASSELIPYFQMLSIAYMVYVVWGLVLAVIRKRTNANLIFLGILVLFSLVINDILINLRIIDGVLLVSFGLVGLIMCQNYVTYSRFIIAGEQNKHLSIELGNRNVELEKFSKSLEELVSSRTSELSSANEQLEILAANDSLTSVLNRRGLMQYIESAKLRFDTDNTPFCLLLIDFDNFKKLNDTYGHEIGDKALVEGSQKMSATVRKQDNVGRWGGEEFLILLNNTEIAEAKEIAQGVRVVIAELVTQSIGSKVTVSIGVSQFVANETVEKSISRADEALYKAKDLGRNRVELLL